MRHGHTTSPTLLDRLAAAPDDAAWTLFHDQYADLIRGYARVRGVRPASCDDIVQEVFVTLIRRLPTFRYDRDRGRFRGLLHRLVRNAIADRAAADARARGGAAPFAPLPERDAPDGGAHDVPTDEAWERAWRRHHVDRAMRTIESEFSERDRLAFRLCVATSESGASIAERLGVTVDTVYQAKSRITRRLGELVAAQVAEEG